MTSIVLATGRGEEIPLPGKPIGQQLGLPVRILASFFPQKILHTIITRLNSSYLTLSISRNGGWEKQVT